MICTVVVLTVSLLAVIRKVPFACLRTDFQSRIYVLNSNPYIGRVYLEQDTKAGPDGK